MAITILLITGLLGAIAGPATQALTVNSSGQILNTNLHITFPPNTTVVISYLSSSNLLPAAIVPRGISATYPLVDTTTTNSDGSTNHALSVIISGGGSGGESSFGTYEFHNRNFMIATNSVPLNTFNNTDGGASAYPSSELTVMPFSGYVTNVMFYNAYAVSSGATVSVKGVTTSAGANGSVSNSGTQSATFNKGDLLSFDYRATNDYNQVSGSFSVEIIKQ